MARAARPEWAPAEVDLTRASVARMYDYFLGGSHNLEVDRELAEKLIAVRPEIPTLAFANRSFLQRVVRFLAAVGIRQFLDIGSGIPTVGNVHEAAQAVAPESRVVYVDIDPVAVMHTRVILHGDDRAGVVQADVSHPEVILEAAPTRRLLDLSAPVGLLLLSVLHYAPDSDEPYRAVRLLQDAMPAGSYLALSHGLIGPYAETNDRVGALYAQTTTPGVGRDLAAVQRFFGDWQPVPPGMVPVTRWRPDPSDDPPDPAMTEQAGRWLFGGVAVKP